MNYVPEKELGIIGGGGFYDIAGLTNKRWERSLRAVWRAISELLFIELD
ncbi:MAG: hypothetical protein IPN81_11215, partial [Nitrosomonadales bacterium]|nr:hypothetical protein [Nitrosomonadales bacterium]